MSDFDFTQEELQLNKKGTLSQRQKGVLKSMAGGMRSAWKSGVWVILFFMVLGAAILVGLFFLSMDARQRQAMLPQLGVGICLSAVAVAIVVAIGVVISYRRAAQWEKAQLFVAEGAVSHGSDYSPNSNIHSYYVYIGKKRFSFLDKMSRTFPEGSMFRIYYCRVGQTELIMSFEKLG